MNDAVDDATFSENIFQSRTQKVLPQNALTMFAESNLDLNDKCTVGCGLRIITSIRSKQRKSRRRFRRGGSRLKRWPEKNDYLLKVTFELREEMNRHRAFKMWKWIDVKLGSTRNHHDHDRLKSYLLVFVIVLTTIWGNKIALLLVVRRRGICVFYHGNRIKFV